MTVLHTLMPHIWVILIQVVAFFVKVLVVCWLQAFVRWSLPRFRYDQLMKMGWRVLLPASLANIFVTGVLVLGIGRAGLGAEAALKVMADLTQALVLAVGVAVAVAVVAGFLQPGRHLRSIAGSSAKLAMARGGTKSTPMQA